MKIALRPLDSIKPYERNPRNNEAAVDAVAASIQEFGFRQPIVVDADGVIIVGHVRYRAATKLGLAKVPVHVATDLTADQARALRIADNRTNELADWDWAKLGLELADLKDANYDVGSLLLGDDWLTTAAAGGGIAGLTDPDDVPAPPDAAITQPGDLIFLGNHRLLCGDSSNPNDLDRLLRGAPIHLVNMDPPYNVKVEPRSNNAIAAGLSSFAGTTSNQSADVARDPSKAKATAKKLRPKDRPLANDFVSDAAFVDLLDAWFKNAARVLIPGGGFYIWGGYANVANYPPALAAAELYFSQAIIWTKGHPVLTRKDFMGDHEWCFYGWRAGAAHRFFGADNIADVWKHEPVRARKAGRDEVLVKIGTELYDQLPRDVWPVKKLHSSKMVHLTEKPVELAARAMQYSSLPGENVLDLFGGSGSTLIAAEQQGRRAFLMELDPLYCDVIIARWEAFTGQKAQRQTEGVKANARCKPSKTDARGKADRCRAPARNR